MPPHVGSAFDAVFLPWLSSRFEDVRDAEARGSELRPLNAFAAEYVAQAVFRRLGINTAPTEILSLEEARRLPENFVVKIAKSNSEVVLHWDRNRLPTASIQRNEFCLVSELIPGAASLDFVRRTFGILHESPVDQVMDEICEKMTRAYERSAARIASALGKGCPAADNFYSDFKPTAEQLSRIRNAARWDSPEYLRICAARLFCGISAPHAGNVLTTMNGRLVSLDHCAARREDGEDLWMLFRFIRRDSDAFKILGEISAITEQNIWDSVAEIPDHTACGSTAELADYFIERLRLWQSLFGDGSSSEETQVGRFAAAV
ncbi:MAG: hypothetical protein ACRD4M_07655 [Candidatus Acidiferrales bacterium]